MQRPLNWWISIFLVLAALRGLILGVSGLVLPALMPVPFELTPLTRALSPHSILPADRPAADVVCAYV